MPRLKSPAAPTRTARPAAAKTAGRAPAAAKAATTKKAEQSLKTRERILDAAEELFAQHGLHGVTLREIAKHAHVDTALLHYYYGTKQGVFDAVLERRSGVLNRDRMAALDAYEARMGAKMTLDGAISAFLRPVFEWSHCGGRGWKNYCALVAQVNNTPTWGGKTMARQFDPVVQRLIAVLRRILPKAHDEDLYWCYHLLSGALTLTLSETGRIDILSGKLCRSSDLEAIEPRMVAYCAAGFRKVCERA